MEVLSLSQMRAMAILFIGPHRNPDFASDYHLSPILAPSHLLARFPSLLMSCGEKDPFVDDTVIFAGRVREAKRARRKELEAALSTESARFGEQLRMSVHEAGRDDASVRAMQRELYEHSSQTEEDWVQMQIFSEWSHGYMQMPRLMQEARTVINDMADWMDEVFEARRRGRSRGGKPAMTKTKRRASRQQRIPTRAEDGSTSFASETEVETETDEGLTFAPKRRSPPNSFSGQPDSSASQSRPDSRHLNKGAFGKQVNGVKGSLGEGASRNGQLATGQAHQPGASLPLDGGSGTAAMLPAQHIGMAVKSVSPSPPAGPAKGGSPGKAGQTITESELMRRRRLLDSHLVIPVGNLERVV